MKVAQNKTSDASKNQKDELDLENSQDWQLTAVQNPFTPIQAKQENPFSSTSNNNPFLNNASGSLPTFNNTTPKIIDFTSIPIQKKEEKHQDEEQGIEEVNEKAPIQQKTAEIPNTPPEDITDKPEDEDMPMQTSTHQNTSDQTGESSLSSKAQEIASTDFSNVQFKESQSASNMGALAYTQGNQVTFAPGKYQPQTKSGQELIWHELTHVKQQRDGIVKPTTQAKGLPVNDDPSLENEADQVAKEIVINNQKLPNNKKTSPNSLTTSTLQFKNDLQAEDKDEPVQMLKKEEEDKQPQKSTSKGQSKKNNEDKSKNKPSNPKANKANTPSVDKTNQAESRSKDKASPNNKDKNTKKKEEGKGKGGAKKKKGDEKPEGAIPLGGGGSGTGGGGANLGPMGGGTRMTDIPVPSKDGGPERLISKQLNEAGAVTEELLSKSESALKSGVGNIVDLGQKEKQSDSANEKIKQTEEAVVEKLEDKKSEVQATQTQSMDAVIPPKTDKDGPKQQLQDAISNNMPTSLKEAFKFKSQSKATKVGNQVSGLIKGETQKVEQTYQKIEDTPPPPPPKESTPLTEIEPPIETKNLNLGEGLAPPVEEAKLDFSEYTQESDNLLDKEKITEEQLNMVDAGDLYEARMNRDEIKQKHKDEPAQIRQFEQQKKQETKKQLNEEEQKEKAVMRQQRNKQLQQAKNDQHGTKSKLELEREKVTQKINQIYEKANKDVKAKLSKLEKDSLKAFDQVQKNASQTFEDNVKSRLDAFKERRYSGITGKIKWGKDKLLGMDDLPEVKEILESERKRFVDSLDAAINKIMQESQATIDECKNIIAEARKQIDEFVKNLKPSLKKVAEKSQKDIQRKLDALSKEVNKASEKLKGMLIEKQKEYVVVMNERIAEIKDSMGGLVSKLAGLLLDAALKFFRWGLEKLGFNPKSLDDILNKGKTVLMKIVTDPIGFFKNMGSAVGKGIGQFASNIKKHLIGGLVSWLTGAMGDLPIQLPAVWDIKGILHLGLQVLGLTWNNLRQKLVKLVGEPVVNFAEGTIDVVKRVINEGPIALWDMIKEKAGEIKTLVMEGIRNWVITQVVKTAITKVVMMLNPAGAILQAIKDIYDVVMFFVTNIDRIMSLVKSVLSSVKNIAMGNIGGAANSIEQSMAKTIPIILSFLARFLGLSGISKKIKEIIQKIRRPVDQAVNKGLKWMAKKAKKLFGKSKKGKVKKSEKDIEKEERQDKKEIKVKKSFSMGGTSHKLTTIYSNRRVRTIMASNTGELISKVKGEIKEQTEKARESKNKTNQKKHRKAATELQGIVNLYNTKSKKIVATKDFSKIQVGLEKLNNEVAKKAILIGNKYGLKDFLYDAFDIKTPLNAIKSQIEDQLEKHVGSESSTVIGDGHANSATAAELALGWKHEQTGTNHLYKTGTAKGVILSSLEKLDDLIGKGADNIGIQKEEWYVRGKEAVEDCNRATGSATAYLKSKGMYKVFLRNIKDQRSKGIDVGHDNIVKKHNL